MKQNSMIDAQRIAEAVDFLDKATFFGEPALSLDFDELRYALMIAMKEIESCRKSYNAAEKRVVNMMDTCISIKYPNYRTKFEP